MGVKVPKALVRFHCPIRRETAGLGGTEEQALSLRNRRGRSGFSTRRILDSRLLRPWQGEADGRRRERVEERRGWGVRAEVQRRAKAGLENDGPATPSFAGCRPNGATTPSRIHAASREHRPIRGTWAGVVVQDGVVASASGGQEHAHFTLTRRPWEPHAAVPAAALPCEPQSLRCPGAAMKPP